MMSAYYNEECFETGKKVSIINGKLHLHNRVLKTEHIKLTQRLIMELSDSENTIYRNVTEPGNYMYFYNEWYSGAWDFVEVRLINLGDCK